MKSQYLQRCPASIAVGSLCYYCNRRMQRIGMRSISYPYTRTLDHIHLASLGGYQYELDREWKDQVHNHRPCCYECNQLRTRLDHCCGLLMMILMEASNTGLSRDDAAYRLGIATPFQRRLTRQVRHQTRWQTVRTAMAYGI